jgi:hypothetical protein
MTPTTTTRRERLPALGGVLPLPDDLMPLAPDEIRAASEHFADAQVRHRQALADLRGAREAAEQAARADREAAAVAVAEGKSVPKPTEPAARARAAGAERVAPAAEELARRAQGEFVRALRAHLAEFRATVEGELAQARATLDALLADAETALARGRYLRALLAELDPHELTGRRVSFAPRSPKRGLGSEVDAAFDTLRAVVSSGLRPAIDGRSEPATR